MVLPFQILTGHGTVHSVACVLLELGRTILVLSSYGFIFLNI